MLSKHITSGYLATKQVDHHGITMIIHIQASAERTKIRQQFHNRKWLKVTTGNQCYTDKTALDTFWSILPPTVAVPDYISRTEIWRYDSVKKNTKNYCAYSIGFYILHPATCLSLGGLILSYDDCGYKDYCKVSPCCNLVNALQLILRSSSWSQLTSAIQTTSIKWWIVNGLALPTHLSLNIFVLLPIGNTRKPTW